MDKVQWTASSQLLMTTVQGCSEPTALEGRGLRCTYLARQELDSVNIVHCKKYQQCLHFQLMMSQICVAQVLPFQHSLF